jgi:hypothetical protein
MAEKNRSRFKAAAEREKVKPGGSEPITPVEEVEPVVVPETPAEEPVATPTDLLAGLTPAKPEGKTTGFYLSTEAIKLLDKAAKQNKCSKSKVLDTLIRNALK